MLSLKRKSVLLLLTIFTHSSETEEIEGKNYRKYEQK